MTYEEISAALCEIEESFPVAEWTVNDLHVWPLIKVHLALDLQKKTTPEASPTDSKKAETPAHSLSQRMINKISYEIEKRRTARERRQAEKKLEQPFNALFLSYPMYRTALDGAMYNRLLDPIRDQLAQQNISSLMLELNEAGVQHSLPTYKADSTVNIDTLLAEHRNKHFPFEKFRPAVSLQGYDEMVDKLYSQASNRHFNFNILKISNHTLSARHFFRQLLESKQVQHIYTTCFYGYQNMGLYAAARELGVPTADVQHGVIGPLHPVYSNWTTMPEEGYELLPDLFYCWSESDAVFIKHWSENAAGHHDVVVYGNPWLKMWEEKDKNDRTDPSMAPLLSLRDKYPDKKWILYSLQPTPQQDVIPGHMLETMQRSKDKYLWLIRLHPQQINLSDQIEKILKEANIKNYEIKQATHLPLPAILLHTDVHITQYSSVILEAGYFGVPSVATHPEAQKLYPAEAAKGKLFSTGENVATILHILDQDFGNP